MINLFPAMVQYQLALLETYEANLAHIVWDEMQLNEALKAWLASLLPMLSAQRKLSEQMLAAHREAIGQYRSLLQQMLQSGGHRAP